MEVSPNNYHFAGWVTCSNKLCSDGRTISPDAFAHHDGDIVPLVWNHQHNDVNNILGKVLLHSRDGNMYGYGLFNDTESGQTAKDLVDHGDIVSLSICANQLQHSANRHVTHGMIREVSLVLAGANPGAYIDSVIKHGEATDEEAIIYSGEELELYHAESDQEEKEVADEAKKPEESEDEETLADIIDTMNEKQQTAMYAMISMALESGAGDDEDDKDNEEEKEIEHSEGGDDTMKKNIFEKEDSRETGVLYHADQVEIINMAKSSTVGTFQNAWAQYVEQNNLQHSDVSGFQQTGAEGELTIDALFPEYKDLKSGAPDLITNDQGWISVVMSKVHKSPISRIRTGQVDIRNIDALRAKGYQKGKEKQLTGNFTLVRRTTDPQTVYVKNALHRDDIVDITDFDYVEYLYRIDRMMLNEELATAIMFGDNRGDDEDDKIRPEHIRPIWTDDDLYTLHVNLDVEGTKNKLQGTNTGANFGDGFVRSEALIAACLDARVQYKGSGTPDMFIDPYQLNVMLLARDMNGRRIYSSKSELAAALNVGNIYTVEQMGNKTRKDGEGNTKKLLCIIANLADYTLGATKGGEITHFTQFDIDFNQQKSLLETRCSGALTKIYSAIAVEEPVAAG